ncbi:MAG: hypothetical protein IIA45_09200 [Bacteroidetes bacterium]|nr:hypothetical protein [Bacteroidota bacterium]
MEIRSLGILNGLHSSLKPYRANDVLTIVDSFFAGASLHGQSSRITEFIGNELKLVDSSGLMNEKPLLKYFYKYKSDLVRVNDEDFLLRLNPVFHFQYGKEFGDSGKRYINTRGVELRGSINEKLNFYAFVSENQAEHMNYVGKKIEDEQAVPGEGFYKEFKKTGVDYFNTNGYISFQALKNVSVQFGHGKNFLGNGHRSLLLSDNSNNTLFLKLNTHVWKINYQNLFMEVVGDYTRGFDTLLSKKYVAIHHLSLNVNKNLNIGLSEAIVFTRDNKFDYQYLNPIIFYRSIEQDLGSPDNAMVAMDFKYNFLQHFSLYGQLLIDEFNFYQFVDSVNWWGNKFGGQIGLKYIDIAGIEYLDGQVEVNVVRPYTYTHYGGNLSNYTHFNQALAHPLGANFKEMIGKLYYQPTSKLNIAAKFLSAVYGADGDTINWGGNIFLDYNTRKGDYDQELIQGVRTYLHHFEAVTSYQVIHNVFVDLIYIYRRLDSQINSRDLESNYIGIALRMNISQKHHDF